MRTWILSSTVLAAVGIAGIVILELYALSKGINGVALSASIAGVVAIITGVPTYFFGRNKGRRGLREELAEAQAAPPDEPALLSLDDFVVPQSRETRGKRGAKRVSGDEYYVSRRQPRG